ncbi:LysR family transcriptional regulator [Gallibacterium salpingitidis]|uniref:LysR family transcriptional regulator n=1 Tax=Gallibacterium salpingitidis TaxID=505341 RepID=A0A1A7P352_9PAST|nr:LysR family transcriptional regulator [Gallibacterium salpingitidis]OBW96433.1 LysR family transcriptional regulator [Gallibacterium salpingitidis]OBX06474.1 LysR family transcriptional regulator [Gallibacterium salpingitidis]OBX08899.1 LysR family transcriptional regulator [Gallibacterium salpingitidis]WKS99414.1 LysR family transcriptional regulator [Gallibacterium salpingitidis]
MDQLLAMRVFTKVVDTGSFNKAAEQLNIPRSTVSKLVQDLENHLTIKLLHRTTRQLSITPEGKEYYGYAVRIIEELDFAKQAVLGRRYQPSGVLHIEAPSLLAEHWLISKLPDFHRQFPDIKLRLTISDRIAHLISENVDCALRIGQITDESLIARPLMTLDFVNCASSAYLAHFGTPQTLADLSLHQIVGYQNDNGKVKSLIFVLNDEQWQAPAPHFACNKGTGLIAMLKAGLGIGQTFRLLVQDELASGELVEVLPQYCHPTMLLSLVYPANRHKNARLAVFIDWLMALSRDMQSS